VSNCFKIVQEGCYMVVLGCLLVSLFRGLRGLGAIRGLRV
jgi:hypothetical protein